MPHFCQYLFAMPQLSLLEPSSSPPFATSIQAVTGSTFAETATALCVIAVALLGFAMLMGRVPIRYGISVIVGCFVVLGAPVLASSLVALASPSGAGVAADLPPSSPPDLRQDLQPATEDPYAGA